MLDSLSELNASLGGVWVSGGRIGRDGWTVFSFSRDRSKRYLVLHKPAAEEGNEMAKTQWGASLLYHGTFMMLPQTHYCILVK